MTDADAVAAEIQKLEDERYQAMVNADIAALDRLLSDRLVYDHSNGARDTKESYLQKVRDGVFDYRSVDHPTDRITVLGDAAAVVVGGMRGEVVIGGQATMLNNGALAVWAAEEDGWALVAYQPTPLPT